MKAVIYARYSSDNQREESIEGQLRENKAFAEKNGIEIIGTYIDRALSAKTDNRPEFRKMIDDSSKGLFDLVIVWKLDRFARNRYDSAFYKATLKKNNVKVVSATENISEGADGVLLEAILEGFAEYYSAELAEKIKRGLTENAIKLRCNGVRAPIGYYIDGDKHFQIDEDTAPINQTSIRSNSCKAVEVLCGSRLPRELSAEQADWGERKPPFSSSAVCSLPPSKIRDFCHLPHQREALAWCKSGRQIPIFRTDVPLLMAPGFRGGCHRR